MVPFIQHPLNNRNCRKEKGSACGNRLGDYMIARGETAGREGEWGGKASKREGRGERLAHKACGRQTAVLRKHALFPTPSVLFRRISYQPSAVLEREKWPVDTRELTNCPLN